MKTKLLQDKKKTVTDSNLIDLIIDANIDTERELGAQCTDWGQEVQDKVKAHKSRQKLLDDAKFFKDCQVNKAEILLHRGGLWDVIFRMFLQATETVDGGGGGGGGGYRGYGHQYYDIFGADFNYHNGYTNFGRLAVRFIFFNTRTLGD